MWAPIGITDFKNVFIRIHRDRQIQQQIVQKIPTDKADLKREYDQLYAKYLEKKKKYDEQMVIYKKFKRKEEIEKCQSRLKKLKAGSE